MRALKAAVIVMGVLIVAGVVTIVVTIVRRATSGSAQTSAPGVIPGMPQQAILAEPDGTRIAGVSAAGDRLAVHLQGGGPDRVLVLDARTGTVLLRASLAQ